MAAVSDGAVTRLGLFDHGQPPISGLSHVIGSVTAVDSSSGTLTLTVTGGPDAGQVVTPQVNAHTPVFVGDPTGQGRLADVNAGDSVGVGFPGSFSSQVTAPVVYDLSNPPSSDA